MVSFLENFKNIKGIAKAKSEIIENIVNGGTIILNRDDKYFNYLYKKAKSQKLKISTFGKDNRSDISLKRIIKRKNCSKVVINIDNQIVDFEIKAENIYNVLNFISYFERIKS